MRVLALFTAAVLIGSALGAAFNRVTAPELGPCEIPEAYCIRLDLGENQP